MVSPTGIAASSGGPETVIVGIVVIVGEEERAEVDGFCISALGSACSWIERVSCVWFVKI